MAHKLPDEILKEILYPVLQVDDHSFSDTSAKSPFSLMNYSNSEILVVCKRWLRVATPLLYNVVILRSTAQAQALAAALKANGQLGLFIKKLRLEGGFGTSVGNIILAAPNITDIYLSLAIWSTDSVTGLCRGLPFMNPSRVVVKDARIQRNSQMRRLFSTICSCIKIWSNMKTFHYFSDFNNRFPLFQALKTSPSVEKICIFHAVFVSSLEEIADIPSLKVIEVEAYGPPFSFAEAAAANPKLLALVQFKDPPARPLITPRISVCQNIPSASDVPASPQTPNPCYVPMQLVAIDIQDKIWSRVLEFALNSSLPCEIGSSNFVATRLRNNRASLLLVSKQFEKLSIPHLYRHIYITRLVALNSLADRLVASPSLALYIRSFSVCIDDCHVTGMVEATYKILSRTTGLVRVHGMKSTNPFSTSTFPKMDWDSFNVLARTSGSTLHVFHDYEVISPSRLQKVDAFNSFVNLRSLRWSSSTVFDVNPNWISPAALASLETIYFKVYDRTFAEILSRMALPSLSQVIFHDYASDTFPFLLAHGSKIHELEFQNCDNLPPRMFDVCSNLRLLTLGTWSSPMPESNFFICRQANPSLAIVKLNMNVPSAKGEAFFRSLNPAHFPALVEIRCRACHWPRSEREIARDSWHRWAEILLQWGVKLTDAAGIHWRPRLKRQRRTRESHSK